MGSSRTKNSLRNVASGLINKIITLFIPFIIRTIIIKVLGAEYLGLSNLFASILNVLSLAELGVGSAMVFSMYKPIAEDNKTEISALLYLYKRVYQAIGLFILIAGLILLPFIDKIINGDLPAGLNIYILYIFSLLNTVISYLMFAYKSSLLNAFQRNDIESNIMSCVNIGLYTLAIAGLLVFKNYYFYAVLFPIATVVINLVRSKIVDYKYPEYVTYGQIDNKAKNVIIKNVSALVGHKIGGIISGSIDTLVISSYFGLKMIAMYGNYHYIITALIGIMSILYSAITASVGNSIVLESKEKNYKDFKKFNFIYMFVTSVFCVCLAALYQHFIKMWVGEEYMLGNEIVILSIIYFFCSNMRRIVLLYKDASGMWMADVAKPYFEAITNLVLNLILVRYIGLAGIIIATIISMGLVAFPWECSVLFKGLFKISMVGFVLKLIYYAGATSISCVAAVMICNLLPSEGIVIFIAKGIISAMIGACLLIIMYLPLPEFKGAFVFATGIIKKKTVGR